MALYIFLLQLGLIESRFHYFKHASLRILSWFPNPSNPIFIHFLYKHTSKNTRRTMGTCFGKSAGPSKRGHKAARRLLEPVYLTSVCNGIILQPWLFRIFTFWMLWRVSLSFLMSHISCLRYWWTVYCPPKSNASPPTHRRLRIWDDPRITMEIHQFSSQSPRQQKPWKLVPRLPKIVKNRPWNHEKSNFYRSWFVQYLPCQMHVFPIPDTLI